MSAISFRIHPGKHPRPDLDPSHEARGAIRRRTTSYPLPSSDSEGALALHQKELFEKILSCAIPASSVDITAQRPTSPIDTTVQELVKKDIFHFPTIIPHSTQIHQHCNELSLLRHIELVHGKIRGLPSAFLQTADSTLLKGSESYAGNLTNLAIDKLNDMQQLSLLQEFVTIICAVKFLNITLAIKEGSGIIHGNIQPSSILYKFLEEDKIELCLWNFKASYSHNYYIDIWQSSSKEKDWLPPLYTEDYALPTDKELLKRYLLLGQRKEAKHLFNKMEVYALGRTLEYLLSHLTFLRTCPSFHVYLQTIVCLMTQHYPGSRISFQDAAIYLTQRIGPV